ncbi:MMPL family transporter, partial [bacterium]|nr:MMPL family transporter [bacterium]
MKTIYYKIVAFLIIITALTVAGFFSKKAIKLEFSGSVSELVVVEKSASPLTSEAQMRGDEEIIITLSGEKLFTVEGIKDLEKITEIISHHKMDDSDAKPDLNKGKFLIVVLSAANSAIPRHRPYTERNVDRKNLIGCCYAIKQAEDTYKKYKGTDTSKILFDIHNSPVFPNFPDDGLNRAVEFLSEDTFWLRAPENIPELEDFRNDINQGIFKRNLISTDFKTAAIYLRVAPDLETKMHSVISQIKKSIYPFSKKYDIEFAGYPVLKEEVRESIISDCKMFAVLAIVFWTIAFWTCFRTMRGILLPLINLIISELCLLGIMAEFGLKLNAVLFIVPVFLVAVGSSGSIHMMTRFYKSIWNGIPPVNASLQAVKEVLVPLITSALTTAFGFGMLMISNVKGLNQFATLCITGLGLNTIGTLLVIPSFNILLPSPGKIASSIKSNKAKWGAFVTWIVKRRSIIIPVFFILSIISLIGIKFIIADNDLTRLLDRDSKALKTMKKLSLHLGGATIIKLDILGSPGSIIRKESLRKMRILQKKITEIEGVDKSMSIVDLFDLAYSLRTYPMPNNVSDFESQCVINSHVHFLEELKEWYAFTKHSAAIDSMLRMFASRDYSTAVMTIQSSDMSLIGLNRIRDSILNETRKLFKTPFTITVRGEMLSINRAVERVIKGQTNGVIYSLTAVFFTMLLIFLSLKVAIIAIIPNIVPIL